MSEATTAPRRRVRAFFHHPGLVALLLLLGLAWSSLAAAVGVPSTYAGCASRSVSVAWGGTVNVDLSTCHFFGLGVVSTPATHGSVTPGDPEPLDSYNYTHNGSTPVGGGSDSFVVLDDNSDFITVTVTINPPVSAIVVSPATLPTLTAGNAFSQTLTSSGGTGPYSYGVQSGLLPPGLTLNSAGLLSGTPTQRGGYAFTVRSTDNTAAFVDKAYSGTVAAPSLSISPNSGTAIQTVPFTDTLAVSGGVAPHTFALESGAFPGGINISTAGVISGTTAAAPGNYPVVLRVTDASTGPGAYFELENYTLTVSAAPSVSITVSPASVSEDGATNLVYTITRSLLLSSPTTVNLTTSGSATSGVDYTGAVATATIPANATSTTVTLDPTADGTVEADETVTLTVAAGTGYTVGAPSSATGTILNDDVPTATITVSPAAVAEDGAANLIYTVTLSQQSLVPVSVNYTIGGTATGGTDYATITSPLVIPANTLTGTIAVNPTPDASIEANETVILSLAAGTGYTVGAPNAATGTILNDDLPNLTINDVTAAEGNAGATVFTFTVSLSAPAGPGGVTFDIATASGSATDGSDYIGQSLTGQNIPAGGTTSTFAVQVNGDSLNELNETFFVNVTNVVNAIVVDGQGVGTIVNDDPLPALAIGDASSPEGDAGTTNMVFSVTLSGASGQTVFVNYVTADLSATAPGDYTSTSGTLVFAPGVTVQQILVPVVGDTVPESDESFIVNLSGSIAATISDSQGQGTIVNDDVPVTITPASLPGGTVAAAYSQVVSASGGTGPYSYSVPLGSLPSGLSISPSTGTISGTPTAGGTFNFTVRAFDSSPSPGPFSGDQAYSVTIAAPTIVLPATTLADGNLNQAYSAPINAASGGTAPYSYVVSGGALPGGLVVNAATGEITGTPTAFGTFNFDITATDSSTGTGPYTATQSYTLVVIDAPPVANAVSVTVPYGAGPTAVALNITGGGATSVAVASAASNGSAVAAGMVITYQPNAGFAGADSFTYTATGPGGTSPAATVSVTVSDPVIAIVPGGPLAATVGVAYSQTFTFTGGAQPWSGYQVTSLPAGVSITGTTANSVTISGTPSAAGSFALNVSATDSSTGNGPYTVGQAFTLDVSAPVLTLTPAPGTLNVPYGVAFSQAFSAGGGIGPYGYLVSGVLPAGMSFSSGTLSGTPTVPGSYPISVTATDNGSTGVGAPFMITQNYTIDVPAPTIVVTPGTLPDPSAGTAYSQALSASGGVGPYAFTISAGAPPTGLTLSGAGTLSGTPTAVGTFNFTVTATDANGQAGSQPYSVTVGAPTLVLSPAAGALNAPYATAFSRSFTASGGSGNFSYALSGALPSGMAFAGNTLSGTPVAPGNYPISVTATDTTLTGAGAPFTVTNAYTLVVPAPAIVVNPAALSGGIAGQAYAAALSATGGAAPYTFAVSAGGLPAGLSLAADGALAGTPTESGSFNFTATATDRFGQTGSRAYTLVIAAPTLSITPATLPSGIVGLGYTQAVSASGGIAPYSFAVSSGNLPAGLSLAADGAISGTPTAAGTFGFTITATDSTGGTPGTASQAYSVEIVYAPPVAVDDAATVLAGESIAIAVTANDTSLVPITGIAIVSPPAEGTATVSGLEVIYTAPTLASPQVSFTYVASGPGGTSAPATVTVTINPLPIPVAQAVSTPAATAVTVDITAGASGGPFTAAEVLSVAPAGAGTATIAAGGTGYRLTFTPAAAFEGQALVQFTVSNAFATSAPTTLQVTVEPRPDPSADPEVRGLIDGQVDSTRRFATAQITNFQQRLEQLHNSGNGGHQNTLSFSATRECLEPLVGHSIEPCGQDLDALNGIGGGTGNTGGLGGGNGAPAASAGSGSGSPWGSWIGGVIRSGKLDGSAGRAGLDFESDGLSAGIDYRVNAEFVVGAGFGWGQDEVEVGRNDSRIEGRARTLALYASWHPGQRWFVDGLLGVQDLRFDLRRYLPSTTGFVTGRRDGDQWFASVSAGAEYRRDGLMISPYARLDVAQGTLDGYTESGHPVLALAYKSMDVETSIGTLGLRLDWRQARDWGSFTPQLRLEYQQDFSGRSDAELGYADLPGGPVYGVAASRFDRNRFVAGLGVLFDTRSGWNWRLEYRGQLGGDGQDNGVQVNVQKQF